MFAVSGETQPVGDQPLRDVIESLGGWPVLEPDWLTTRWDWTVEKTLGKLRGQHDAQILIMMWVAADDKNSSVNIIQVGSLYRCIVRHKLNAVRSSVYVLNYSSASARYSKQRGEVICINQLSINQIGPQMRSQMPDT